MKLLKAVKVSAVALAALVALSAFSGCNKKSPSSENTSKTQAKTITLKVSLGSNTPSEDQVVSPQNPNVFSSTYRIAEEYVKKNPNVVIEWDRTINYTSKDAWSQYLTTLIASGRAPDIVYGWNGDMIYKNWYMDLTDEFERPNPYIQGNQKWKETMPVYIFSEITDTKGRILGVPVTVFPGTATAYFYNKDIFKKLNMSPPKSWSDLKECVKKATAAGYVGFGTNSNANIRQLGNNWDIQFTLGPSYGMKMKSSLDYNKDGFFSKNEIARSIYEGQFSSTKNPVGQDFWKNIKTKYVEILPKGYEGTDFKGLWDKGQLAIYEEGLWILPDELSNTKRTFDFGMVPPVVITSESSKYVGKIEYTESGPYKPQLMEAYSVIDPKLQNKSEDVGKAAIDFLKFLTVPENLNTVVLERKGACIGAVMGTDVPPELTEWFRNSFPMMDSFRWQAPATSEGQTNASRLMQQWFNGSVSDAQFYTQMDQIYQDDIASYIKNNEIDTTGWKK